MLCEVCQRPAEVQCTACGLFFCSDHGGDRCFRCLAGLVSIPTNVVEKQSNTGIYTTEKESRFSGKGFLQCYSEPGMATVFLDDPEPPSCKQCGAIARELCFSCHQLFCLKHRGGKELCQKCARSAWMSIWIFLAAVGLVVILLVLNQIVANGGWSLNFFPSLSGK